MYKNTLKFMMKRKHDEVNDNPSPMKKKNHEDNTIDKKRKREEEISFSNKKIKLDEMFIYSQMKRTIMLYT